MRVISGIFKGKKIFLPEDENTRPLRDLVKESIFNLILHSKNIKPNIYSSSILDLFSGTGYIYRQKKKNFISSKQLHNMSHFTQ